MDGRSNPNYKQCAARNKQTGEQCRARAVTGKNVCYYHGGATPSGFANPNTKTGRHSKDLPTRYAATYFDSLMSKRQLELTPEIALIDSRLSEVMLQLSSGESGAAWGAIDDCYRRLSSAVKENKKPVIDQILGEMGLIIAGVIDDRSIWNELRVLIDDRRRLVESERKRKVEAQTVFTAEQALMLFGVIEQIIRQNVSDPASLQRIGREFKKLVKFDTEEVSVDA